MSTDIHRSGIISEEKEGTEITGLHEEIANVQTAIADFESGHKLNVAIIAEPFTGKTALLNQIDKMNPQKITKLSFSSIVKNKEEIMLPEQSKRVVMMDNCEFLYMRKIGNFDVLEEFLKLAASPGMMFITAWNLYSWNYLNEVMNIGKFFPVRLNPGKFTAAEIKEIILSKYETNEIKFVEDAESDEEKLIHFVRYTVEIKSLKRTINIPLLKINYDALKVGLFRKEETINTEDLIFEKIGRVSNGNPGVAKVVWEKSLEYPVIKPGKVKEFSIKIDLDYDESFILCIILSMKSIKKEDLVELTGTETQIDRTLFRLVEQDLISIEDGYCSIRPEALRSIVEFLRRSRLVW